jgi:hypothetical protein
VFDEHGGFWFTDHGIRHERVADRTGIYYASDYRQQGIACIGPRRTRVVCINAPSHLLARWGR